MYENVAREQAEDLVVAQLRAGAALASKFQIIGKVTMSYCSLRFLS